MALGEELPKQVFGHPWLLQGGEKMSNFVPGHLDKNSEAKINNVNVVNGQVIYSEKSGMQFIDYADKRHTYDPPGPDRCP